jgi:hypothetical protein
LSKERVDDLDKSVSLGVGATARRSTSSLGPVIKRALLWVWAALGVPLTYAGVARRMAPPWEWPFSTKVNVTLLILEILLVGSGLWALFATRQFGARRIDKVAVWAIYIVVVGYFCAIFDLPFSSSPPFD